MTQTRRQFLSATAGLALLPALPRIAMAATPTLTVAPRQLDVLGKAAKVYGIIGPDGRPGLTAHEGQRFTGAVDNQSGGDLILHWHGQILARNTDDRTRPNGGVQPTGTVEGYDFPLTPGTHWMHSHSLTEQQLLAAPMVTIPADAGTMPEATIMLHDFSFRPPAEIAAGLLTAKSHHMASMAMSGQGTGKMDMSGQDMGKMDMGAMMPGMTHANDVDYDAYLANDRTLDDPQVIRVSPGPMRLRLINGATATAFWLSTGPLVAEVVAVDGNPVTPISRAAIPLAQGQRIDLVVSIPPEGGAFPILAQVEDATMRTGVILATPGASVAKLSSNADTKAPFMDLTFEASLSTLTPLPAKPADATLHLTLGMEPGYRWTINGAAHGEAPPLKAALGSRVEMMFMNPTMMMHPMHLHGHHFQVVDLGLGRFNGPRRDVVMVAPGGMVTVAVDFDKPGDWFLHCHHLYHMAGGMMTSVTVA
jgi:FtsP/CotA-like multicopper oxidase with cupredoxin domain